jgi:hypothetical protein
LFKNLGLYSHHFYWVLLFEKTLGSPFTGMVVLVITHGNSSSGRGQLDSQAQS